MRVEVRLIIGLYRKSLSLEIIYSIKQQRKSHNIHLLQITNSSNSTADTEAR